jgi:UDP-N-acetylglucosamine/UDP-N-acetylgalactosamine diphosphorylase
MNVEELKARLQDADQEHLLQYWNELSDSEKQELYNELSHRDFKEINEFYKTAMADVASASEKLDELLEPLPKAVCGRVVKTDPETLSQYNNDGMYGWEVCSLITMFSFFK